MKYRIERCYCKTGWVIVAFTATTHEGHQLAVARGRHFSTRALARQAMRDIRAYEAAYEAAYESAYGEYPL